MIDETGPVTHTQILSKERCIYVYRERKREVRKDVYMYTEREREK